MKKSVFVRILLGTILATTLLGFPMHQAKAGGTNTIEYLAIEDYPFRPAMGPEIEITSPNGLSILQVSYDSVTYERTFDLVPGSNFFQTYGWKGFRFVESPGVAIYIPIQNESKYWDATQGDGLVFKPHIFKSYVPVIFR